MLADTLLTEHYVNQKYDRKKTQIKQMLADPLLTEHYAKAGLRAVLIDQQHGLSFSSYCYCYFPFSSYCYCYLSFSSNWDKQIINWHHPWIWLSNKCN